MFEAPITLQLGQQVSRLGLVATRALPAAARPAGQKREPAPPAALLRETFAGRI